MLKGPGGVSFPLGETDVERKRWKSVAAAALASAAEIAAANDRFRYDPK